MKILSFFISCFISLVLVSCGVEVDKQPTPSLQAPSAESTAAGDGFSLSSVEDATFSFSGSGLFIDPDANVLDVQRVIEASVDSRIAKSKITEIRSEILPNIQSKLNTIDAQIEKLKNPVVTPQIKSEFVRQSVDWYSDFLELGDGDLGKQKAKRFHGYCEALLWKYALDKELVHSQFDQLPIPSLACGDVYAKIGVFDKACPADSKNHFKCFWKEAVAKTEIFKAYSTEQQQIILKLVNSGDLLEFLQKPLQRIKLASVVFAQAKMATSLARKLAKKKHDKNTIKTLFLIEDAPEGYFTPKMLMEKILIEDYLFVEEYPEDFKKQVIESLESLAPFSDQHSLTDRFYNQPKKLQKQTNALELSSTPFAFLESGKVDDAKLKTLQAQKLELSKHYQIASKTVETIEDQLIGSLPATIEHMNKPGLANAFLSLNVVYQVKTSSSQSEFSFSFDKNRFDNRNAHKDLFYFQVCMNPEKTLQVPCEEQGGVSDTKVEYDPAIKQLTITKDFLGEPAAWGLAAQDKASSKDGSFNQLNQLKLERSQVVIKIAHGRLNKFEFTSGSILLYDNGELWHEGSFSLMP